MKQSVRDSKRCSRKHPKLDSARGRPFDTGELAVPPISAPADRDFGGSTENSAIDETGSTGFEPALLVSRSEGEWRGRSSPLRTSQGFARRFKPHSF
jgi:hypothetical protein